MSQGAKANVSGQIFEEKISDYLHSSNIDCVSQYKYLPSGGGNSRRADFYIRSKKTILEAKNQNVSGTADQKLENEIWTAYETFREDPNVEKYILVLGGTHWQKPSQRYKIDRAKRLAEHIVLEGDEISILIMTYQEFREDVEKSKCFTNFM